MSAPTYYADHFERAVQALRPFLRQPRMVGVVGAFSEEAQQLEDTLYAMVETGGVEAASGDALDAWGDLVGEPRAGLLDGEYRRVILARLQVNRSTGTPEEVIAITSTLMGDAESVQYFPRYPAAYALSYTSEAPTSESLRARYRAMLEEATVAGVGIDEIVEAGAGLPFAFLEYDAGPAGGFGEGFFAEDF